MADIMDSKVQMMDAGTAVFTMEEGFGSALGQVRAEMRSLGKVYDNDGMIILDTSGIWMKRYVSCLLEDAGTFNGEHRYAAVFKEGSRGTAFRSFTHGTLVLASVLALSVPHFCFPELACFPLSLAAACLGIFTAYSWTRPSRSSVRTLKKLKTKVEGLTYLKK